MTPVDKKVMEGGCERQWAVAARPVVALADIREHRPRALIAT
jgi:hypothetical protein